MSSNNFEGQHTPECGNSTGHLKKELWSFESKLQEEQGKPARLRHWRHVRLYLDSDADKWTVKAPHQPEQTGARLQLSSITQWLGAGL